MFVYNAHATADQSKALWQACLMALQAHIPHTQIDLWLKAIEPLSLTQTTYDNKIHVLLHCQTKQVQKINAIVSQFQILIEQQCQLLCGYTVEWSLSAAQSQFDTRSTIFNTAIQGSLLDSHYIAVDTEWENETIDLKSTDSFGSTINTTQSIASTVSNPSNAVNFNNRINDSPVLKLNETNTNQSKTGLNSRLSFEHFIVGKANQMVHAAAQHIANNPGISYNPFFLYGGVGLGKTHLVHAVGNAVLANNPHARIRYIHANQFIADVVASYRRQTFESFKQYYHSLDVLLIDDIQFFADKKRTQEEFFHAFETLVANRSQIILTSDTFPKDLTDIENRLVSRFSAGLVAAVDPPELEMRMAILQEKAKILMIPLPDDIAWHIAKNLRSNVRELEGALHKLLAYSRFKHLPITLETAKIALRDIISKPTVTVSIHTIQAVVADFYKIKLSDLQGKRRLASLVIPRQVAMYLIKEMTQKSLPHIGEAFDKRDHTTVLHAIRKITIEKANNPQLNHQIHIIQQLLTG